MSVLDVVDATHLDKLAGAGAVVVHFWAEWCQPCQALDAVLEQLATKHAGLRFARVEAEACPSLSQAWAIKVVPTFVIVRGSPARLVSRLEGAKTAELVALVAQTAAGADQPAAAAATEAPKANGPDELRARLHRLVNHAPVMLFMKGTPADPQCGFSRKAIALLNETKARFSSFNILEHPDVRAGLKEVYEWPTFPQLYANGKLVGGLDIMKELAEEGELVGALPPAAFAPEPVAVVGDADYAALVNRAPVMLFMKGSADAPQCGFSASMVGLLREQGIRFETFDILSDPKVRSGLKEYAQWPTFPQLWVSGKLLGGLDVVREMAEEDELLLSVPAEWKK